MLSLVMVTLAEKGVTETLGSPEGRALTAELCWLLPWLLVVREPCEKWSPEPYWRPRAPPTLWHGECPDNHRQRGHIAL